MHRFTNYTQLYHGLEAILHYGQVDVDSSLQNRTFERKIGPFSDQFAPKSPIADQSPRKSDLVGTLDRDLSEREKHIEKQKVLEARREAFGEILYKYYPPWSTG